ncbi:YlbF family regulator [Thermatribacter velox]|uniref:YlbF family regulator n=1 Tax=Thermatribacter velox TaxID=3039681 RepID=A0ABZ2YDM4_9BACT
MKNLMLSEEIKSSLQDFAEKLIATSFFQTFQQSRSNLTNNQEALELLQRWNEKQRELSEIASERDLQEKDFMEVEAIREAIFKNVILMNYFKAQDELVTFLKEVNRELSNILGFDFALSAAQPDPEEETWE